MRTAIFVGFLYLCDAVSPGWEPPYLALTAVILALAALADTLELLNKVPRRNK